jgi:8-oxo-dGTP diphosphatase
MRLPRVGVGVVVVRDGRVLVGRRRGSHGGGTWALPGGHLEFGESVEDCARREVREETGLEIADLRPGPYASTLFEDEGRHAVTLFVVAAWAGGEATLREPDKCAAWLWRTWDDLPEPLFPTLEALRRTGFVP